MPKLAQIPTAGEQIIILGSIRVYPQRGEYQLSVWQTLPAGVGLQALRYQQLKNRLLAEGLFDAQRKRSLPIHPQTIAVVASPTAAAWGDIQKTMIAPLPKVRSIWFSTIVSAFCLPEVSVLIAIPASNASKYMVLRSVSLGI